MKSKVYFYKGYFIQKDRGGNGWNIYGRHTIPFEEGVASLNQAKEEIDEYIKSRENKLPWEE